VGVFLALQLAILAVVLIKAKSHGSDFIAAVADKHFRLATTLGRRVVVVGGSSAAFSLDSSRFKHDLSLEPVNMGVHAGLGLDYILADLPPRDLHPGDLVILNLEYEHFCLDNATADLVIDALEARPQSVFAVDARLWKRLLDDGLTWPTKSLRALVATKEAAGPKSADPYSRSAFNEFGDVVGHLTLPVPVDYRARRIAGAKLEPSLTEFERAVSELNALADRCREHGALTAFVFPAYPKSAFVRNEAAIAWINTQLRRELHMPVLNTPEDSVAPDDYFFDTEYHLNATGVAWRTGQLIPKLEALAGERRFAHNLSFLSADDRRKGRIFGRAQEPTPRQQKAAAGLQKPERDFDSSEAMLPGTAADSAVGADGSTQQRLRVRSKSESP
jgi:hypothetical protein